MNIRLKLVLSAAALAAGCVLLAGCGGSASSASSSASSAASSGAASQSASEPAASVSAEENGASDAVASAVDTLLEADPISNQFEITAMNIEYDFGLKAARGKCGGSRRLPAAKRYSRGSFLKMRLSIRSGFLISWRFLFPLRHRAQTLL